MTDFPISARNLKNYPADFRIEAIIADGMWYSLTKWRKLAKVTEEEINDWVARNMEDGDLLQSPTGAKSFRYSYDTVVRWHNEQQLDLGAPIFDFIFPARVWDDCTEVEGFLASPLRDIGVITFECSDPVAREVRQALRGVARIRETDPGKFKAYCLSANYVKPIVQEIFEKHTVAEASRIYSRGSSKRREIIDFTPNFAHHLVNFYKNFAKALLKKEMETIKIYLPDPIDQHSQIVDWIITAIEKFDESSSVPFSGYLNSVLKRWPYDLPSIYLGRDLSLFQRDRSKAIKAMKARKGDEGPFSSVELAEEMGLKLTDFMDLEEKHHIWIKAKNASSLVWEDSSEEKQGEKIVGSLGESAVSDKVQSNRLSLALIEAAIKSGHYQDAIMVVDQMGIDDLDVQRLREASPAFVLALGEELGLTQGD